MEGKRPADRPGIITSTTNDHVKYVRSLYRRRARYGERMFVVEGLRAVEEALKAGIQPVLLFHTPALLDSSRARALLSQAEESGVTSKPVNESVMSVMADTVHPSGILAVLPMTEPSVPASLNWALILDNVRDPGNLGAILRSALAADVEWIITTTGTVDAYSPKVVRAGVGAHFRLRLWLDQPWSAVQTVLPGQVLVASPKDGDPYWNVDWRRPTALVIGGEAEGAAPEAAHLATGHVTIPMRSDVESLNAAVAAGVLLFEAARQRSEH
jgi:TrmH family RNA methyltransferase